MTRFRIAHYLRTSLWVVPVVFVIGGIVLSLIATAVDHGSLVPQSITGDPQAALQILYLISFAMLTLTGLVLSLLVVAVQLAMGTFSPRIVRQIVQDRPSQLAIGLFAGTFAFSMVSMRKVHVATQGGKVPGLAVVTAMALVVLCIGTLVWYLNHVAQSLRTAALVQWVADDTITALDRVYPDRGAKPETAADLIIAPHSGVIFKIGYDHLVRLAERADCCLEVLWGLGEYVPLGSPLVRITGDPDRLSPAKVTDYIALGPERTLNEDVAYGIRMLVDIANRTLSSGPFGDPTTATQAIDRLQDILRQVARRPMHSGEYRDAAGVLRLRVPTMRWDGLVRLAFEELRQAGAGSPQVTRRLTAALDDLIGFAPPERRPVLERERALLHEQASRAAPTDADRETSQKSDLDGIGNSAPILAATDRRRS